MTQLNAELLAAIAQIVGAKAPRKTRKAKGQGRTKLTDEQKAVNAKVNAEVAVKMFQDAGYENCVAHETIKTYGDAVKGTGWLGVGRKVMKGQKAIRTPKGVALFHLDQTEAIAKAN